jgi:MFS family permease
VQSVSGAAQSKGSAKLIATSFMALFAVVGLTLYGLPMYYDKFVTDLGWSRATVQSGNFWGKVLIGPLFGLLIGYIIDRKGPRPTMIIGMLLAGTAVFGLGSVHGYWPFLLFYCFNALAYVMAGPLPNQVLLAQNFKERRGAAMGAAYLGIGAGFFLVPLISNFLIARFGWRGALHGLGGIVVLAGLPLVLLLRRENTSAPLAKKDTVPLWQVLRQRNFYLLALGSFASVGAVGGMNANLKLLLTLDQHRAQSAAFYILAVVAAVSLLGRFGAGWLADKIGPKRVMLIVYTLVMSAALLLVWGPTGNTIYLFAVVFGLGLGGEYMIIPLMAGELFGVALLGRVMGIVVTFDGAAEAVFPWVVGKIHDQTHSYHLGFQVLTAIAALGAVAIALLPSRTRRRGIALTASPERSSAAS